MVSLAELAKEVHLRVEHEEGVPSLKRTGVFEILKGTFDVMAQAIVAGEEVAIPKFGKFSLVERSSRKGRNPKTGESMEISARMALRFRPSSVIRASVAEIPVKSAESKASPVKTATKKKKKKKK